MFAILDSIEGAPGVQIHTGQIGTTIIPDDMDVVVDVKPSDKATRDRSASDDAMKICDSS